MDAYVALAQRRYPRMTDGGAILIRDYFNPFYKGVNAALDGFAKSNGAHTLPIGDGFSVAFRR